MPSISLGPKPRPWDLIAGVVLAVSLAAAVFNWLAAEKQAPGSSLSGGTTFGYMMIQGLLASVSLVALGKTAKHGTLWGNLAAVGGMFIGLSGVLLATALWIAA